MSCFALRRRLFSVNKQYPRHWPKLSPAVLTATALLLGVHPAGSASTPASVQFQVNTVTASGQNRPVVAASAIGTFVVVWESYASGGTDNSARSIQARLYGADGAPSSAQFQVNTSTTGDQTVPAVAMADNGDFVVVWESNHQASDYNIMAQPFSAAGVKQGSELLVNSAFTTGDQSAPAVAMADNGDFVVVWVSPGGAGADPNLSIQGRRWSASSAGFFDQLLVNDVTAGDQGEPAIATDGSGAYLVAWRHPDLSLDIAIRSFTADDFVAEGLVADAPQQTANTFPSGPQTAPSVAMSYVGNAVVAWESFGASFGSDVARYSIQLRRLDATGSFIDGNDVQVNTYTTDDQRYPAVTMGPDGNFAVVWQSYGSAGSDGSDYSIQLRSFDRSGVALDSSDVQVNTYTLGAQTSGSAALAPNGRLLVAWESNGSPGNDTNGYSVQGRFFTVCSLFCDDFESGGMSQWSAVYP